MSFLEFAKLLQNVLHVVGQLVAIGEVKWAAMMAVKTIRELDYLSTLSIIFLNFPICENAII